MRLHDRRPTRFRPLLATFLITALLLSASSAMAIEEPAYHVVRTLEDVEVRDYPPYTVAEVEVDGPAGEAGGQAFPILFKYISGGNAGDHRLQMTAPVVQSAPVSAPVARSSNPRIASDRSVVQFVMPNGVMRSTAPAPLDARVRIRDVPAQRYAVIRYSGFWSDANFAEHLARLEATIAKSGLHPIGDPLFARYDAPFKPWFMRRNEIWLALDSN